MLIQIFHEYEGFPPLVQDAYTVYIADENASFLSK